MKNNLLLFSPIAATCLLLAQHGQAQDNAIKIHDVAPGAAATFWTPELLEAAKPFPTPHAAPGASVSNAPAAADQEKPQSSNAHPPALQMRLPVRRLFTPAPDAVDERAIARPRAGTYLRYTSTRVFPLFDGAAAPYSADRTWPYITVGKLFFTRNHAPFFCSASVIQHRIVVTAGHCVHSGTPGGFFDHWLFVPAYRDGTAPLLTWNWRVAIVPGTWATGGGVVPNGADYAMLVFADQQAGGSTYALGDVTGWLGWLTLTLKYNHTSKLGYPCNLDSCQKMQDITGNAHGSEPVTNTVPYGSDAKDGSDGGPWVQNFQQLQAGGGTGYFAGPNQVVGVASYDASAPGGQAQGSSTPDGRWIGIFNILCGLAPGNCL